MRQIGTLVDPRQAQRFADYLLTQGIKTQVDTGQNGTVIWVRDEDHLPQAKTELESFRAAPDDPRYQASREAGQLRSEAQAQAKRYQKNQVDVRRHWTNGAVVRRGPATLTLVAISVAVTLMSNFGKPASEVTQFCWISTVPLVEGATFRQVLPEVQHGQIWRLLTPIFLHYSVWHIIFNMLWLLDLGNMIEARRGRVRYLALVAAIALISNLAEYVFGGSPYFGGMSGVVFGLFGYIWMKTRFEPGSGFYLTSNTVFWMIAWLLFCFTGYAGPIANLAHAVGLGVGIVIGIAPRLFLPR